MPSIEDLNKKRAEIERKKREIADRAAERAAKEYEARLAAEAESLDWELEQVKQSEKMQTEARRAEAKGTTNGSVSDDEIKRLVAAAKAKAAGGTPVRPKTNGSGGTPTTAAKSEEK